MHGPMNVKNKGIVITFSKPYYKQSSATQIKCLAQLHYTS